MRKFVISAICLAIMLLSTSCGATTNTSEAIATSKPTTTKAQETVSNATQTTTVVATSVTNSVKNETTVKKTEKKVVAAKKATTTKKKSSTKKATSAKKKSTKKSEYKYLTRADYDWACEKARDYIKNHDYACYWEGASGYVFESCAVAEGPEDWQVNTKEELLAEMIDTIETELDGYRYHNPDCHVLMSIKIVPYDNSNAPHIGKFKWIQRCDGGFGPRPGDVWDMPAYDLSQMTPVPEVDSLD